MKTHTYIALEELKKEQNKLTEELQSIRNSIRILERSLKDEDKQDSKNGMMNLNLNYEDYQASWSLKTKVKYFIQKERRFLHNRELIDLIQTRESNLKLKTRQVSTVLSKLKSINKIVSYKFDANNKNCFWGAPSWLDSEGKIKPEHKYNEDYLFEAGREEIVIE